MGDKTIERRLLTEIITRLDEMQLHGILEELGREGDIGKAFCKILEEDLHWNAETPLDIDELKKNLKKELEASQDYRREFYKELIHFVDRIQKTDAQVYRAIGMNRTLWYRLRDNKNARTNKRNVLKMAIILQLNYWEMYYFVNLAGYSLLPGNDGTDRVVSFCVRNRIYDESKVDELLLEAGEKTLFSEK